MWRSGLGTTYNPQIMKAPHNDHHEALADRTDDASPSGSRTCDGNVMEVLRVIAHALRPQAPRVDPETHVQRWLDDSGGGGFLDLCVIGIKVEQATGVQLSETDWQSLTRLSHLDLDILFLRECAADFTFARLAELIADRIDAEASHSGQHAASTELSADSARTLERFIRAVVPKIEPFALGTALSNRLAPNEFERIWNYLHWRLPGQVPPLPANKPPILFGISASAWRWLTCALLGYGLASAFAVDLGRGSAAELPAMLPFALFLGTILTGVLSLPLSVGLMIIGWGVRSLRGTAAMLPQGIETFGDIAGILAGERGGWCEQCGYDLTGMATGRCPECGREIRREIGSVLGTEPRP